MSSLQSEIGFFCSIGLIIDAIEWRGFVPVKLVDRGVNQAIPSVKDEILPSTVNRRAAVVSMLNTILEDVYGQDFTSPDSEFGFKIIPWKGQPHVYLFAPEGEQFDPYQMRQAMLNYQGLLKTRIPPAGAMPEFDPQRHIVIGPQRHEAFVFIDSVMQHAINLAHDTALPLDSAEFLDLGIIQKPYHSINDEYGFYVCHREPYLALFENDKPFFNPFSPAQRVDDHPFGTGPLN